jgi:hypothetical protein
MAGSPCTSTILSLSIVTQLKNKSKTKHFTSFVEWKFTLKITLKSIIKMKKKSGLPTKSQLSLVAF